MTVNEPNKRRIFDWHRYLTTGRCQALDMNGHWCRHNAAYEGGYHGDSESTGYDDDELVGWVLVRLCDKHVGPYEKRQAGLPDGKESTRG